LKRHNPGIKRWIADFDDLLFGMVDDSPAVLCGRASAEKVQTMVARYRVCLRQFEFITCSTTTLARAIRVVHPTARVGVVHNTIDSTWVTRGKAQAEHWQPGMPRVVRYFSGTSSHDLDFPVCIKALNEFMRRHGDVRLEIVGRLRSDLSLLPPDRVTHLEPMPYAELPKYLASSWVNVAPLRWSSFTACKSGIKTLEAGVFGCPCIGTPIADQLRLQPAGFLPASTHQQWYDHLESLLNDEFRVRISHQSQRYIQATQMDFHGATALLRQLGEWFG
jgi:glycosyltransferase involved in cell wall biosynthesis